MQLGVLRTTDICILGVSARAEENQDSSRSRSVKPCRAAKDFGDLLLGSGV